jgi:DNA-binding beta-propeller fold protein YncE
LFAVGLSVSADAPAGVAPCALGVSPDGATLYVAERLTRQLAFVNTADGQVRASVALPEEPSGLAVAPDGKRVFVTCQKPLGLVCSVDPAAARLAGTIGVGYGAIGPAFTPDGTTLAVCNQFDDTVTLLDAHSGKPPATVRVTHQPVAAAATRAGRLFVANLTPVGPGDGAVVAARIDVIDLASGQVSSSLELPDGSSCVLGVTVSPDDATVYVTHKLGRYHQPTTQLERGWVNTNALTLIDAKSAQRLNTVLLDEVDRGAANPWSVSCNDTQVVVSQAGTHDVSVIDAAGLRALLDKAAKRHRPLSADDGGEGGTTAEDVPDDLTFLRTVRRRVPLGINGPRALVVVGNQAWAAGYFSDDLARLPLDGGAPTIYPLAKPAPMPEARRGEMLFCDATMCFQSWHSCLSCHPDTRTDGLNWDLLNDGIGNPKHSKSLVTAMRQNPVMSLGVRADAKAGVRAGIRFIEFAVRPESDAAAIDAYLEALRPDASPKLVKGRLSAAARRGKVLFEDAKVGCASCHSGPLFTNEKGYDLGTGTGVDLGRPFVTSPLVEVWRSGPWLHDGRAANMLDVLGKCNPGDHHGHTSQLKPTELADLAEYVLSL